MVVNPLAVVFLIIMVGVFSAAWAEYVTSSHYKLKLKKYKDSFTEVTFGGVDNDGDILLRIKSDDLHVKTLYITFAQVVTAINRSSSSKKYQSYFSLGSLASKPEPSKDQSSIWHVLGMMPTNDKSKVTAAFRKMAMVYHPDHGGSETAFRVLTEARDKALQKCK